MQKILLIGGVIVVVLGVGAFLYYQSSQQPSDEGAMVDDHMGSDAMVEDDAMMDDHMEEGGAMDSGDAMMDDHMTENVIVYTDTGFSPKTLTIQQGEKVTFKNESSRAFWPASDIHPSHTVYDGTTLQEHCANPDATTFDSCGSVATGAEWSFTFTKTGTWHYHDHNRASNTGIITVQ